MANAVNMAANRALASAAACHKLDVALSQRAEALARSRAADSAVMAARREAVKAAAALKSASRMLAECNRTVKGRVRPTSPSTTARRSGRAVRYTPTPSRATSACSSAA